jgi:hypothetical protein
MKPRVVLAMDRDLAVPAAWALERAGFETVIARNDESPDLADASVVFVQDGDGPIRAVPSSNVKCVYVTSRPEHVSTLRTHGHGVLLMPIGPSDVVRCARLLLADPPAVPCCTG